MDDEARTGVFLVRAWLEGEPPANVLRARITASIPGDLSLSAQESVVGSPQEAIAALQIWLQRLTGLA